MKKLNIWIILLYLIVLYFVFQIREDVIRFRELIGERANLKTRIGELKESITDQRRRLSRLKQGYYIESLARERLNLIKKGETGFKVCP